MKSVINSSSSFSLFILLISWSLLLLLSHCVIVFSLNSEGVALLSLLNKFSFEDSYSAKKLDWNNLSSSNIISPCGWSGVGCNTEKTHVVSLDLNYHGIAGQLGPQIGQLTYLQYLDLSNNNFSGSIPIELWNCSHLQHLDLSGNDFTCEFPHEAAMRNLHQLKTFSIYRNKFSGRIPEYFFHQNSGLETVVLSWNNFTGSIPINIGNAANMKFLGLSNNQLHGGIPSSITNCTKLEVLDLSNNNGGGGLSGEIPLGVWRIPTLVHMDVSKNNLSGELPVEITELRLLKRIYLRENHFFGSVPKDLGINNTHLEEVDFSNNAFSGEIPPNLCSGQKLTDMNLNLNQFHGNIPSSYTRNCDSLTKLTLQGNNLIGSLPHFAQINNRHPTHDLQWTKFQSLVLDLSRNQFYGQIPSSICSRFYLSELDLSDNQMNGSLPHCLGGGHAYLKILKLRNNNFSGTIPWEFTNPNMYSLDLNGNCLEGKIPRSLGNSTLLQYLDLGNNQLDDTFPFFLGESLPNLQILVLRSNKLYGPLPKQYPHSRYSSSSGLKILDISNNYFSGNLPSGFILGLDAMKKIVMIESLPYYIPISTVVMHKGIELTLNQTMMNTFRAIDMSNNRFQGNIPGSIGEELMVLMSLNFSNNNLNGRIPSSLGKLKQLESLDLSKNKLYGEIPGQLTGLTFLAVLNLSHNNLTGPIPTAGQFPSFPNDAFVGNPGLCGLQSSTGCPLPEDPVVEKESDEDSNSWNFTWVPVVIGYGCGVLIAVVIQYFIFTKASMYRWFG